MAGATAYVNIILTALFAIGFIFIEIIILAGKLPAFIKCIETHILILFMNMKYFNLIFPKGQWSITRIAIILIFFAILDLLLFITNIIISA